VREIRDEKILKHLKPKKTVKSQKGLKSPEKHRVPLFVRKTGGGIKRIPSLPSAGT